MRRSGRTTRGAPAAVPPVGSALPHGAPQPQQPAEGGRHAKQGQPPAQGALCGRAASGPHVLFVSINSPPRGLRICVSPCLHSCAVPRGTRGLSPRPEAAAEGECLPSVRSVPSEFRRRRKSFLETSDRSPLEHAVPFGSAFQSARSESRGWKFAFPIVALRGAFLRLRRRQPRRSPLSAVPPTAPRCRTRTSPTHGSSRRRRRCPRGLGRRHRQRPPAQPAGRSAAVPPAAAGPAGRRARSSSVSGDLSARAPGPAACVRRETWPGGGSGGGGGARLPAASPPRPAPPGPALSAALGPAPLRGMIALLPGRCP